jgi:1-acyl-sn-glycerol-3-phosphate acyltransferase
MSVLVSAPDRSVASRMFYAFCRAVVVIVCGSLWRVRTIGREQVPTSGPMIIAPTHRSGLDIPLAGFVTRRPTRFMGKVELWKYPTLGKFMTALGGFPVRRGEADRQALATALQYLEVGAPLAVFPEGTRRTGDVVDALEEGVVYLAMKSGATIVPVGIGGSEAILAKGRALPRFSAVDIVIGTPIRVERAQGRLDRQTMAELTIALQVELQQCFDEANARVRMRSGATA